MELINKDLYKIRYIPWTINGCDVWYIFLNFLIMYIKKCLFSKFLRLIYTTQEEFWKDDI